VIIAEEFFSFLRISVVSCEAVHHLPFALDMSRQELASIE